MKGMWFKMKKTTTAIITYDTEEDTYDIRLKNPLSVCWQITTKCNYIVNIAYPAQE